MKASRKEKIKFYLKAIITLAFHHPYHWRYQYDKLKREWEQGR